MLCKVFPDYVANNIVNLFCIPREIMQPEHEREFENSTKHNILKIPTKGYRERQEKFVENNQDRKEMKLNSIPNMPEEITVLEFLPEKNPPKDVTIICIHGWEARSTNFYKFIPKLIKSGFRVLGPDFPKHGKTGGEETGCHCFGYALNCILNYLQTPVILLAHSLGNGATCMNYFLSDQKTRNQIKGFVGIGIPDKFTDFMIYFGKNVGLDDYTINLFIDKTSEKLGLDVNYLVVSEIIKNFNYPYLIVHDEKDKEISIDWAINTSKFI